MVPGYMVTVSHSYTHTLTHTHTVHCMQVQDADGSIHGKASMDTARGAAGDATVWNLEFDNDSGLMGMYRVLSTVYVY